MSASSSDLVLLHQTLQSAPAVTAAVYGNFTAPRAQEVAVVRGGGQFLALLRPNEHSGKMDTVAEENAFGVIRCMAAFRLVGGTRDYLALGSDSGSLVIVQWSAAAGRFVKVHQETYGKSGVRRTVPGQYVSVDPKGRAVMLSAFEKAKLVYVLNRDQAAQLTISSPLEAHKSNMITFSTTAMDVSFDNPIFAALEADPNEELTAEEMAEQAAQPAAAPPLVHKYLTFYELDLGLNHVTRSYTQQVDMRAHLLIPVPGGESGPGGVLICAENAVYYKSSDNSDDAHRAFLRAPFPKRFGFDSNEKGTLITSWASHVQKGLFFFLLQTEHGDLLKVSLVYEEDLVHDLQCKYFDTVPVSAALVVLKSGFLYCASESGNSYLWQFQGIGDEDDVTPMTSSHALAALPPGAAGGGEEEQMVLFTPRVPTNLALVDDIESGAPVLDIRVADLAREYTPQIYTLVGRGPRSSLRVLRHGLAVSEVAVSELPGTPTAVWAIKTSLSHAYMSYIVVSFVSATIVLSIGETVVEVKESGLLDSAPTLHVSILADDSLLQIHPNGMRHIRPDKRIHDWKTPGKKQIACCAANERQIVLALTGGELVYFELDQHAGGGSGGTGTGSGNLLDVQRKDMGNDVAALAIAPVPEGRVRAPFLAVGLFNNTVRVLSLDSAQTLNQLSMQALPAQPSALALVDMQATAASGTSASAAAATAADTQLYLYIGLSNGILMRSQMDESAGSLSDTRKRFLGTRPVRLHRVRVRDSNAVVALSSRNWLSYIHGSRFHMVPLSYDVLEHASPFCSEQCPEGLVCISANTLRIVTLERVGVLFNQTVLPLKYTPRRMAVHPQTQQIVIIETDHNAYSEKQKGELREAMREAEAAANGDEAESMDVDGADPERVKAEKSAASAAAAAAAAAEASVNEVFQGAPHAGEGAWASSIRIVDPVRLETLCLLALEDNEAAFSLAIVQFGEDPQWYLVVGTVQNLTLSPRTFSSGFIHVYRFINQGAQLQFLHKTAVNEVPLALAGFQRRLAVGVGRALRLYDLGKRALLRKCENKNFPQSIQSIQCMHDRLYVGDLCEGFTVVLYRRGPNELEIVADSVAPKYLTAHTLLDFDSIAGADKFGNLFIQRLPRDISKQFQSGSSTAHSAQEQTIATLMNKYGKVLQGASHKLADIANFYVGETVTALTKAALVPGGAEVLIYATLQGGLGVLQPFTAREDAEFFSHLEMHLRQEPATQSLVGRDHLAYRGYYAPVKNVVDGDLCDQFSTHLTQARQTGVAEELVCTPAEVAKRLEELRNRVL